jgi:DNA-binding NtrC family response regulator
MADRPTVLVVDDEAMLRSIFADLLAHEGYGCVTAANAIDALQIIEANLIELDLLITDIRMPGALNGLDLANKVRELQPRTSILLISGFADDPLTKSAAERGYRILAKPFRHAHLAVAIKEELAKKDGDAKSARSTRTSAAIIPLKKATE